MPHLIRLHRDEREWLVNPDLIRCIYAIDRGAVVMFDKEHSVGFDETPRQIAQAISGLTPP